MSNPFILGLRTNPQLFFNELDTSEVQAVAEACIRVLENRHKEGNAEAAGCLQNLYREVANIEL
ncbi:hypothetical protein MTBPR1_40132 [Candidatus Terasakiella magnetica]|uniref:Uncharacterized protein n=1 Tax=Candidatus Terasakiella magnetica TaxID=1867952 RepID=A0A1C3RIM0_9PROT|nr:hypothetical protein [Candidatus Terasakiella magnetica]SCA57109.1 hypothetical protein MTBPR1_40132 [Candidatus Terasakiella magnetica]